MVWTAPSPHLRLTVSRAADRTVLHVAGELQTASVPALAHALSRIEGRGHRVELDLGRVTFCSLAGAELLVQAHHRAAAAGRSVTVHRAHSAVLHTLRLCREPAGLLSRPHGPAHDGEPSHAHELLRDALSLALRLTDAPMGNAQLCDPDAGVLRIVAQQGFHRPFLSYFETVEDRESACGIAAQEQRGVFVEEVRSSPVFLGTPAQDVLEEANVAAVASLPVAAPDGTLVGVISVHLPRPAHWTAEQRRTLESLARATGSTWHSSLHQATSGLPPTRVPRVR
ncbi:GAF domain-containing protein [Streptomyces sp. NPDC059063]|uniref:GAF domain-containing protein n=1 Tax=unclassified Streptomyces TaxID=2593676 RepID=UPI0036B98F0E